MGNVNGREEIGDNSQSGVDGGGRSIKKPWNVKVVMSRVLPLMPVVPLQRPEEMHIANPSWMQTTSGYEDLNDEQGVPTLIPWTYDGKEVAVEGSWDNWKSKNHLQRSEKDFTILKVLSSGVYQYRFIVDGQCRCSPDLPCVQDEVENTYNILDVKDYVPEDIESISGFEPPQSPDCSYSNLQLGAEDYT
ncbi:SNF1-related protein kinase regulatory subunit beta-2-like [Lycium barbarum]|uniref:SNF1-related protein kinase regulatory subunit beta-2-like n=1 Tax=Lycium barbarum TaxID=112863 RepID=UPI00293F266E|nr:SNF1-related protein kinase regulatory subunit beta-2-like [Lycium barbarum]